MYRISSAEQTGIVLISLCDWCLVCDYVLVMRKFWNECYCDVVEGDCWVWSLKMKVFQVLGLKKMGACTAIANGYKLAKIDQDLNEQLTNEQKANEKIHAVLIMGSPNSGKSTLFKQFCSLWIFQSDEQKYNLEGGEKEKVIQNIRQNCVDTIITLCYLIEDKKYVESLQNLSITNQFDYYQMAELISTLWTSTMKRIYKYRYYDQIKSQLYDNMEHFLDRIDEIMDINYEPSQRDLIMYKTNNIRGPIAKEVDGFRFVDNPSYDHDGYERDRIKPMSCLHTDNLRAMIYGQLRSKTFIILNRSKR